MFFIFIIEFLGVPLNLVPKPSVSLASTIHAPTLLHWALKALGYMVFSLQDKYDHITVSTDKRIYIYIIY